jgi:hypothetical protein
LKLELVIKNCVLQGNIMEDCKCCNFGEIRLKNQLNGSKLGTATRWRKNFAPPLREKNFRWKND